MKFFSGRMADSVTISVVGVGAVAINGGMKFLYGQAD